MRVTAKIEGLSRTLKGIENYAKEVRQEVALELQTGAENMVNGAVADAPVDQGILRNGITFKQIDELNFEVVSQAEYSAFLEFGTRSKVKIPAGLEEVAAQFRGQKSAGDAKKMIYDWCKRKGIPEDAWYPIFVKIMTQGVEPHPFFFKQINKERPKLIKRLKKVIER